MGNTACKHGMVTCEEMMLQRSLGQVAKGLAGSPQKVTTRRSSCGKGSRCMCACVLCACPIKHEVFGCEVHLRCDILDEMRVGRCEV